MNSSTRSSIVKCLKDYFIFGSPILVALGFLNIYFYYQFFGVPIQDYLEISEIIMSFLDKTILGALAAGIGAVLMTFLNFKRDMVLKEYESTPLTKRDRITFRINLTVGICGLAGIVTYYLILPSIKQWNKPYYMESSLTGLIIFLVWLVSLFYDLKEYERKKTNAHAKNIFIGAFLTFLLLISFLQIRNVKYNHGTYGTQIKYFENGRYVDFASDSSNYFIGKTRNFVFIFDSDNNTTRVIPIQNVDQLILDIRPVNPFANYQRAAHQD